jgi:predicted transcriptional regulator
MRFGFKRSLNFILFSMAILIVFSAIAHAEGGYVVRPHVNNTSALTDSTGFDFTITFWDLPLKIKLVYIFAALITFIGSLTILPVILGKLKDLQDNKNRNGIQLYILNNPGTTIRETSRHEKLNFIIARHHINKLENAGMVITKRIGKFIRIFPMTGYSDRDMLIIPYLKNETSRSLIMSINDKPGITNHELAEQYELKRSSINWHTDRFLKDGIIIAERSGKQIKYYIKEDMKEAFERLSQLFIKEDKRR